MRPIAGLCLILFTGCTMVPVDSIPRRSSAQIELPATHTTPIRIGVEYLPPDEDFAGWTPGAAGDLSAAFANTDPPRPRASAQPGMVVSQRRSAPVVETGEPNLDFTDLQERWQLTREGIRAVKNPLERVALRFLAEMIGDDHKRVQRAIGSPLLRSQIRLSSDPLSNYLDERDRQDHHRRLTENGTRMVRRPLRNALKELPLFSDVEVAIDTFKTHTVKTTSRSRRRFGRLSVRLRAGRLHDPVELTWIKKGIRISSSQGYLKASFSTELLRDLHFRVRTRYDYNDYNLRLLGDLTYKLNQWTSIHAMAGNLISVDAGLSPYPGGPQDEKRTKGALVLIEHNF